MHSCQHSSAHSPRGFRQTVTEEDGHQASTVKQDPEALPHRSGKALQSDQHNCYISHHHACPADGGDFQRIQHMLHWILMETHTSVMAMSLAPPQDDACTKNTWQPSEVEYPVQQDIQQLGLSCRIIHSRSVSGHRAEIRSRSLSTLHASVKRLTRLIPNGTIARKAMVRDSHRFLHKAYARSPANTVYKRININITEIFVYRHSHAGGMNDRSVSALVKMEAVVHL